MNSISANLNIMIKASEKASKTLIRDFGEVEKLQVSIKGPSDFVSNADTKSEKIIIEELKKAKPNYSILSEEDGSENNKDNKNVWIIRCTPLCNLYCFKVWR
jgi:myo-inositol-1(or 4)-monophosphatase